MLKKKFFIIIIVISYNISMLLWSQETRIAEIQIIEMTGLKRSLDYIELFLQENQDLVPEFNTDLYVEDINTSEKIPCQLISREVFPESAWGTFRIIFPVSIDSYEMKHFYLIKSNVSSLNLPSTDLKLTGNGLELIIDNSYYQANLTKSDKSEAKNHFSGQLRELLFKDYNQLLFRTENRIHWGPNFRRKGLKYYETIAGWEYPKNYKIQNGPYLIRTVRQDKAPDHPQIYLSAVYSFFAGLPFFTFFSEMQFTENTWMELLRNDEMTMDSMFTHVAYQGLDGQVTSLPFHSRYEHLEKNPIENDTPWLCFYHDKKKYAYGSIRIEYNNINTQGNESPKFHPHTMISDGAAGGKYWNRRLISERMTLVPRGSRYREMNAYIVFTIHDMDPFSEIKYWAERLLNPLKIRIIQ